MKDMKDYLHYYIGCDAYVFPAETLTNGWYAAQKNKHGYQDGWGFFQVTIKNYQQVLDARYLLSLRPLSDIKDHEHIESSVAYTDAMALVPDDKSQWVKEWHGEAARVNYLRSKFIDIDGLIDSGLALDKTNQGI